MGKERGKNRRHKTYRQHHHDPCLGIIVVKSRKKVLKRFGQMQVVIQTSYKTNS
jgi:hypothetical protein